MQLPQGNISQGGSFPHFPTGFFGSSAWRRCSIVPQADLALQKKKHNTILSRTEKTKMQTRSKKRKLEPDWEILHIYQIPNS